MSKPDKLTLRERMMEWILRLLGIPTIYPLKDLK